MPMKVVRPDRRRAERRVDRLPSLDGAPEVAGREERRVHCWDLEAKCTEERRRRCGAFFVRRNCWDLWAAEYFPPGRKPCCHQDLDCSECPIAKAKFQGQISIYVSVPARRADDGSVATAKLRTGTVCPYLYSFREEAAGRGDEEVKLAFKCQRRRAVQLHSSYVSDVCATAEYRDCTFFESE